MAFWAAVAALAVLADIAVLCRLLPSGQRDRASERPDRWEGRPVASHAIVATVHLVPIAAAVAVSAFLSRRLSAPHGTGETITRWTVLLVSSTAVLFVLDRLARRALPLAALLKLSMVFPDRAPQRLAVARRAGSVRHLEHRLAEAKALGADDEPARAAEVILSLVAALHGHDRHTRGHSERVRWFADLIADELRLPEEDRDRLRWAALLHDIGKLRIRKRILNKPAALSSHEWRHIHRHPEEGAKITAPLSAWLGEWSLTIVQHHEKFDGSGYPAGLCGDDISLGARIVAVADAYEVMTAVRPYKRAMNAKDARAELTRCAGTHFDPAVVRAFLQVSVGRLRWIAGPAAWVAQLPFIGWVPRLADGAAALTGQAAGVAGAAAGAAAISTAGAVAIPPGSADLDVPSNPPVLLEIPVPDLLEPGTGTSGEEGTVEVLSTRRDKSPVPAPAAVPGDDQQDVPPPAEVAPTNGGASNAEAELPAPTTTEPPKAKGAGGPDGTGGPDKEPPGKADAEPGGGTKPKSSGG